MIQLWLQLLCCDLLVVTEWLVWMYGQWAVKCTVVTVWSNMTVTSIRSPKGSQKVTALPCISTPHCSPTSQLLHSDLRGEERRLSSNIDKRYNERAPKMCTVTSPQEYQRIHNIFTYQMLGSSSPCRLESKSSRSTACLPWSSTTHKQTHRLLTVIHMCIILGLFHVVIKK